MKTIPEDFVEFCRQTNPEKLSKNFLAKHYDTNRCVIDRWLRIHDIQLEISNKKKEELIDLDLFVTDCKSGEFSYDELMSKYSLSKRNICDLIKRNKIDANIRSDDFNPDKTEFLKLLEELGSFTAVAKHYDTTLATILGYRNRNKIKVEKYFGNKTKTIDIEQLKIDCKDKTLSLGKISQKYGVAVSVIRRLAKENGFEAPKTQFDVWSDSRQQIEERLAEFEQLNKAGKTLKEIADENDISIEQLKYAFRKNNIPVVLHSYNKSRGELEVKEFVQNLGFSCVSIKRTYNNKKYEIDCFIEEKKLGIEYCGEFWHSANNGMSKSYHQDKQSWCEEQSITLMTIFEHEWINKQDIIKSMILNKLGLSTKIYARNTEARSIDSSEAKLFHKENHTNGYVNSSLNFGLYHKDELISVLSFAKSRFDKTCEYEITRFSTKKNHVVVGGFGKLFKFSGINSVMTYADLRFGPGKVYQALGFKRISKTPPNYWYFKSENFESRMNFQKSMLKQRFPDLYSEEKTEFDIMKELGYLKIYDCGSYKYHFCENT